MKELKNEGIKELRNGIQCHELSIWYGRDATLQRLVSKFDKHSEFSFCWSGNK